MRALVLPFSPRTRHALDLTLAAWTVCWLVIGIRVGVEVRGLSELSETVTQSGVAITESADALDAISDVPLIGAEVDEATQRAREAGESAQASGQSSQESVRDLSVLLALAIAVIPSLPILGFYLPLRLSLMREATVLRRALENEEEEQLLEMLAGRAVHTLPYRWLIRVSPDPFGDLRARNYGRLAAAELERLGLGDRVPKEWAEGGPVVRRQSRRARRRGTGGNGQ